MCTGDFGARGSCSESQLRTISGDDLLDGRGVAALVDGSETNRCPTSAWAHYVGNKTGVPLGIPKAWKVGEAATPSRRVVKSCGHGVSTRSVLGDTSQVCEPRLLGSAAYRDSVAISHCADA